MELADILKNMVAKGASDVFIKVGTRPAIRVDGLLQYLDFDEVTKKDGDTFFSQIKNDFFVQRFEKYQEADTSYEIQGIGRFRVNTFRQRGKLAMVMRHVQYHIPSFDEINLPTKSLKELCNRPRGLVLVTGVTGSGKSTTIASMLEHINMTQKKHIVTIEDPIEFVYDDKKCVINQRELGLDTTDFPTALKSAMRQSPDVILIGEMRDQETMEAALAAAETGHLVFSTLHSVDATQTVERIINFFPPHQHNLIRMQLSMVLEGVISQRLMRKTDGKGRIPAVEIMISSPTIKDMLHDGKTTELYGAIKEGEYFGSMTFNQCLVNHVKEGTIGKDDAMNAADRPDELELELKGIQKGTRSDMDFDFGKINKGKKGPKPSLKDFMKK